MYFGSWNGQFGCETIHPTKKFTLLNLLQMPCVITWAQSFLTSDLMKAVRGQKHSSEAKNGMKELIYWKKYLIKVSQQPQKPLSGSNQIWATTSDKKDTSQQPQLSPNPRACAKRLRSPQSWIPSYLKRPRMGNVRIRQEKRQFEFLCALWSC